MKSFALCSVCVSLTLTLYHRGFRRRAWEREISRHLTGGRKAAKGRLWEATSCLRLLPNVVNSLHNGNLRMLNLWCLCFPPIISSFLLPHPFHHRYSSPPLAPPISPVSISCPVPVAAPRGCASYIWNPPSFFLSSTSSSPSNSAPLPPPSIHL